MRLILVRHAKSSWNETGAADFDRSLASRGRRDAPLIAADMAKRGLQPTLLIVSAAQRTRETLGYFLQVFSHDAAIRIDGTLYGGDANDYIGKIIEAGDAHDEMLLLGHNPSIHDTALLLAGAGKEPDLSRMKSKFPTAAYCVLDFAASAVEPGAAHLECFVEPRSLAI